MIARFILASAMSVAFAWASTGLLAQTPNPEPQEDPTGHTGVLKANVDTGCGYNSHNGNGARSVTDLQVPGALGDYGLAFTRHWNSVPADEGPELASADPNSDFGSSGWSHSWAFNAEFGAEYPKELRSCDCNDNIWTSSITVNFPDGHVNKYKIVRYDHAVNGIPADPRFGPPYTASESRWQRPSPSGCVKR